MNAKVCILTTVHPSFDTRIFHKESKTLVRMGYDVTLIAQHERDEVADGVKIIALPKPRNRLARIFGLTWRAFRLALRQRADVYHFHDPELLPNGVLLRLFTRAKVIYDVHEDVPRQILSKHWIPGWLRRITACCAEFVETVGARFFDRIVAATPTIARRFPAGKTVVVQNFPKLEELVVDNPTPYTHRPPIVAYVGGIARIRGIEEMVQAIGLLPDAVGARLVLAGSFSPPELEKELRRRTEWERVDFLGWHSREGIRKILSEARVGLVTLHPIPNYLDGYPVKLFEYMSAGIPVVASDFPLWREIVEGAGCGLLVDPLNPEEIANAILWLLERPAEAQAMGKRGREAVRMRYNWSIEAQKLLQMYRELMQ
jgi:glycosyltransferase involved in cell wall biosynthesis